MKLPGFQSVCFLSPPLYKLDCFMKCTALRCSYKSAFQKINIQAPMPFLLAFLVVIFSLEESACSRESLPQMGSPSPRLS